MPSRTPSPRLKPVRTVAANLPGARLPVGESSADGQRETYLWPDTHWQAVPHLGRVRYRRALPELPPHRHENAFELCFLRAGTLRWELDGKPLRLTAGDLLIIAPDSEHGGAWSMMQPCRLDFLQINAGIRGDGLGRLVKALTGAAGRPRAAGAELGLAFDRVLAEVRRRDAWSAETMKAAVVQLLAAALRSPATETHGFSEPVARVVRQLEAEPERWATLQDWARVAGLGVTQLQSRFARETGLTLNAFALDRRLTRAKQMLAEGRSCTETATALGFSSSQYFATAFKRQHGVAPGTLRAAQARSIRRLRRA